MSQPRTGADVSDDGGHDIIQAVVCHIQFQMLDVTGREHIRYLSVQAAQAFDCEFLLALIDLLVVASKPKCKVNRPTVKMEEGVVDPVS
jgi:hypothetical protein